MFVIIEIFGIAIFDSLFISPGEFIPSSSIQNLVFFGIFDNVKGIPISLFRFPLLQYDGLYSFNISNIHSFKVVFPLLPVIHIVTRFLFLTLEYWSNFY